jgi:arabinose-5-phosphate isomerase
MSAALKLVPRDQWFWAERTVEVMRALRCEPKWLDQAVNLLARCTGKVVVTGVGKSGIVAQKIAATLTSTGTLAIFLHPAEAFHGDLGLLQPHDVGLLLSHSGETEEVLALLPFFRDRGVATIGIVGHPASSLAQRVDVPLLSWVDKEACPLNLAPTASTSVALALGDGLAMAAMQRRGFTSKDFARNHPGGRLGRRLTLRVADLMHQGADNPIASPNATWFDVVESLCAHSLGAVNIVAADGRLLGLVTDGDIRRTVQAHAGKSLAELQALTAERFMTRAPTVVPPDCLAYDAMQLMENRPSQVSVLPVVEPETGKCLGLLRLHDLVRSRLS